MGNRPSNPTAAPHAPQETGPPSVAGRLLSGGLWAFSGKLVTAGAGVAISALVARLLSPAEVGAYFLTLSLVTVAAMLARGGLEKTVLQTVAESLGLGQERRARSVVRRIFTLATGGVLVVGAGLWLGGGRWLADHVFSSPVMVMVVALMAPWMAVLAFEVLLAETFRGLHDIPKASVFGGPLSRILVVAVFTALLVARGTSDIQSIVVVSIAAGAANLLVALWVLRHRIARLQRGSAPAVGNAFVLERTWPLLVSNLTLFVIGQADLWIVGAFRPEEDVAIYAVTVRMVMLVGMSLSIVNAVLPPLMGELYAQGRRERLEHVIRLAASAAGVPSFIVLLAFIFVGGPILGALFGPYYRGGAVILAILSLGQLVNVGVGSCGYTLIMTGQQRPLMWSALVSGLISLVGSLILVRTWGTTGVAAAVATGVAIQQGLMLVLAKRLCGVWTHVSPQLALTAASELFSYVKRRRWDERSTS